MIFLIGPYASGKRRYALESLGLSEDEIASGVLDGRPAVRDLQSLVTDVLREGGSPDSLIETLCLKRAVLADEIGAGIIPMDPEERRIREQTGRLCCRLAARADTVIRLMAGIPVALKGTLP